MSVTIKDVAKRANVSPATVSLVIHKHQRISSRTRARVLKAIEELDYHPSRSARGLVSRQSGNIGFILREDHFSRSEPFYTKVFLGTEFQARDDEYYMLLTTIPSSFKEDDPLPRFVLERNVDGIILAGKVPDALVSRLVNYKIPVVCVDYYLSTEKFPVVMIDNIAGGFQATSHLIDYGHRRIAFIAGDKEHPSIYERFQGYKMALEKAAIPFDPLLTSTDEDLPDRAAGYRAAVKLFEQTSDATAIFACNDAMATGLIQYLRQNHIKIPENIAVIGFDDVEADLLMDPPLSTMRVPKEELGIQTLRLLVDTIRGKSTTPQKILVPVELVIRGSTCKLFQ